MTKKIKLKIKNTQLAKAAGLKEFKAKLAGEKTTEKKQPSKEKKAKPKPVEVDETQEQKPRRIRARSKSAFAPEEISREEKKVEEEATAAPEIEEEAKVEEERLGPTGRHVKDLLPKKEEKQPVKEKKKAEEPVKKETEKPEAKAEEKTDAQKGKKVREFKDLKPRRQQVKTFDARDRKGLREGEDERWRKKRGGKQSKIFREEQVIRPSELKIRLPITLKELASEMKLKSSEVIQKLFLHGMIYTLNDILDDETTVQFIGNEFGCNITIDTSEAERIQITAINVRDEIAASEPSELSFRPPVVTFMGHVDHGKTSLIDAIRKSNIASGEAGAITQHIGAFKCKTAVGELTILDTPGHEAFSAMRSRGAEVTDIVVLVVAGDEGLREQTTEAIQHAKAAGVSIVVAINKCDKPNFNAENVYRELSEQELLPEAWGGQTITVNTSAVTGEGISTLLEMLALQAEVLELKANSNMRARGTVLESELHKGMGTVATVLVQNGTLRHGDALVFERHFGRVKTMRDEHGADLQEALPSTPVEITGLSGLPSAGDPFIVVKSEKEAKDIVDVRHVGRQQRALEQRKVATLETLLQQGIGEKKILKLILRADVQGSVEALKTSIQKLESDKVETVIIFIGVGEISESDIQLAAASNAVIIGFHTAIESHADPLIKELGVTVRLFDVIYHAIEDVRNLMQGMLDKIPEERETGRAEVLQTFKSSQLGIIAGCLVTDGVISRNHYVRVLRNEQEIWKGRLASIKRVKEDVKEVKKGVECGILLDGFSDTQAGDVLQAYEIIYLTQEL